MIHQDIKISVILATYLGEYKGAASNREMKLRRAITSALLQSHSNFELIIVCDGCERSYEIACEFNDERIKIIRLPKQPLWSGVVRNAGLDAATGVLCCYLDNDDVFGFEHLAYLAKGVAAHPEFDWYFFNDLIYVGNTGKFVERRCELIKYKCGTSNIAHKNYARWNENDNYDHDWNFITKLKKSNYVRITGFYLVCHIPEKLDI